MNDTELLSRKHPAKSQEPKPDSLLSVQNFSLKYLTRWSKVGLDKDHHINNVGCKENEREFNTEKTNSTKEICSRKPLNIKFRLDFGGQFAKINQKSRMSSFTSYILEEETEDSPAENVFYDENGEETPTSKQHSAAMIRERKNTHLLNHRRLNTFYKKVSNISADDNKRHDQTYTLSGKTNKELNNDLKDPSIFAVSTDTHSSSPREVMHSGERLKDVAQESLYDSPRPQGSNYTERPIYNIPNKHIQPRSLHDVMHYADRLKDAAQESLYDSPRPQGSNCTETPIYNTLNVHFHSSSAKDVMQYEKGSKEFAQESLYDCPRPQGSNDKETPIHTQNKRLYSVQNDQITFFDQQDNINPNFTKVNVQSDVIGCFSVPVVHKGTKQNVKDDNHEFVYDIPRKQHITDKIQLEALFRPEYVNVNYLARRQDKNGPQYMNYPTDPEYGNNPEYCSVDSLGLYSRPISEKDELINVGDAFQRNLSSEKQHVDVHDYVNCKNVKVNPAKSDSNKSHRNF